MKIIFFIPRLSFSSSFSYSTNCFENSLWVQVLNVRRKRVLDKIKGNVDKINLSIKTVCRNLNQTEIEVKISLKWEENREVSKETKI